MANRSNWNMAKITYDFELEVTPHYTIEAARKAVAARALGTEDCSLLLDILGLGVPTTGPPYTCRRCSKEYSRSGTGRKSYFCSKHCYLETLREERKTRDRASTSS